MGHIKKIVTVEFDTRKSYKGDIDSNWWKKVLCVIRSKIIMQEEDWNQDMLLLSVFL